MLGRLIADPEGVEGKAGSCAGLGYLEIETVLMPSKTVRQIEGVLLPSGASVCGYEIHAGASFGPGLKHPFVRLSDGRFDGARSKEGLVCGTYLHGLFDHSASRSALLTQLGIVSEPFENTRRILDTLDALADHLEEHLDLERILFSCRR